MTHAPVSILVFIIGAIVGSFLNVCIVRIPQNESVVAPRSRCRSCGALIPFYLNIPLVSFLVLAGRCRSCKKPIPLRYFLVELLSALLAVALYRHFGFGWLLLPYGVFTASLIAVSFIDIEYRIVPDVISLPGVVAGMLFSLAAVYLPPAHLPPSPASALAGVLLGGGFLFLVAWIYDRLTGREGLGGGDIKLMAMIGAFLGWPAIPVVLFTGSLAGSVLGLTLMLFKGVDRKYAIPFAPFLCLGALLYLFWGESLQPTFRWA